VNHNDYVYLLQKGVPDHIATSRQTWADLGSGTGAFTLALADLLGSDGEIYAVDKNQGALREQQQAMAARFPAANVHYCAGDFTGRLDLPPLDGIVMANALHFVPGLQKDGVILLVKSYLRPGGRLILVEYNVDQGNPWVPYPLSYPTWEAIAHRAGFTDTRLLATKPSRFLKEMFSAVSILPEQA
jgi:ubiquinone/menaquinone biosynthesis C-methylase UbiE